MNKEIDMDFTENDELTIKTDKGKSYVVWFDDCERLVMRKEK